MTESQKLLAEYVMQGSEQAFHNLVARYINLVYSTAVRLVGGDTHRAQDIAQTVFANLARKARARSIPPDVMLGGWLHRDTCFVAAKLIRSERRRQFRERRAMEMNAATDHTEANMAELAPVLDEAIDRLGAKDRAAILLRFFEQRDLRGVGEALGISENAAQKRLSRAQDHLRVLLRARGVALSGTALVSLLAAEAVSAAPASITAAVSATALAGTAGAASTASLMKWMIMTKLKIGIAGAIAVAGVTSTLLIQNQAQARLQRGEQKLKQQSDLLDSLRADRTGLSALAAAPAQHRANTPDELGRLRGEVTALRQRTNELAMLRAEAERSRSHISKQKTALEEREDYTEQAFSKMNSSRNWLTAFHLWADQHDGQFPTNFDQALPLLDEEARHEPTLNEFDIVYHGSLNALSNNVSRIIVLREKQAWFAEGKWARAYAFADGHSEIHSSPDGNYELWERQHLIEPAPGP